ncbi:MAG: hypothetical protein ACPHSE_06490, partial [Flavobacteriaceae bacterium]
MELILLCFNVVLLGLVLFFLISKKGGDKRQETLTALIKFDQQQAQIDKQMKDEFQRNREENHVAFKRQREELA